MGLYTNFTINFYKRKWFCFLTPGCLFLDLFETFCLFRFRIRTCSAFLHADTELFRVVSCVGFLHWYVTYRCVVIVWCGSCVWSVSCAFVFVSVRQCWRCVLGSCSGPVRVVRICSGLCWVGLCRVRTNRIGLVSGWIGLVLRIVSSTRNESSRTCDLCPYRGARSA